jgi:hypothetical protein
VGSLTSHNPIGLHGLLGDSFIFFINTNTVKLTAMNYFNNDDDDDYDDDEMKRQCQAKLWATGIIAE